MKITRQTVSLCPTCYKEIPATVSVTNSEVMIKKFCDAHGDHEAMLERSPLFYTWVIGLKCPSIYNGYFVDVTRTCNMRCNPCYYPLENKDPEDQFSVAEIVNDCIVNAHRAPFILTGGEPTLHHDLHTLISRLNEVGPVELLTNGIKLENRDFFNHIMPLITNKDGSANLNLSIHNETNKWGGVIEHCRADKIRIESCLIVVKDKESFISAIALAKELSDTVISFRIKAETAIWNQKEIGGEKVFVSDMLNWLEEIGHVRLVVEGRQTKPVYLNVIFNGMHLMLLSWHDVGNVDLREIQCPPYYRARNGEVCNFVTTGLINEGMAKGWLKGRKIESIASPVSKFRAAAVKKPVGQEVLASV
jgi:organic radical activating enzyme